MSTVDFQEEPDLINCGAEWAPWHRPRPLSSRTGRILTVAAGLTAVAVVGNSIVPSAPVAKVAHSISSTSSPMSPEVRRALDKTTSRIGSVILSNAVQAGANEFRSGKDSTSIYLDNFTANRATLASQRANFMMVYSPVTKWLRLTESFAAPLPAGGQALAKTEVTKAEVAYTLDGDAAQTLDAAYANPAKLSPQTFQAALQKSGQKTLVFTELCGNPAVLGATQLSLFQNNGYLQQINKGSMSLVTTLQQPTVVEAYSTSAELALNLIQPHA